MNDDENLKRVVGRAAALQDAAAAVEWRANIEAIGAEVGIAPQHMRAAAKDIRRADRQQRRGRALKWVLGIGLAVMLVGVMVIVGIFQMARHALSHHDDFEAQIALIEESRSHLQTHEVATLEDLIARYRATDDADEQLRLMSRANAALDGAFSPSFRFSVAGASLAKENRRLHDVFFFAEH